jgi:hypothetical protein
MVSKQPRFQLFADQPRSAVKEFLQNIDVLAVPSQWLGVAAATRNVQN